MGLPLERSVLKGPIYCLCNESSCTLSFIVFYSYWSYLFAISLPLLSLPAAYHLLLLLFASRIIKWTQVWLLQRDIPWLTYPMLFLVILSYNILFLSLITTLYFYIALFFQLVYRLSFFTRRPHWCHLLLNAEWLKEYLAQKCGLKRGLWVGGGCLAGQMNNEWLGKALTWDLDSWVSISHFTELNDFRTREWALRAIVLLK